MSFACQFPLSQQHRVMVSSKIAERMFGNAVGLVPAKQLLQMRGIDIPEVYRTACRLQVSGKSFQQRGLARAVASEQAEHFAVAHVEGHIAQRPKMIRVAQILRRFSLQAPPPVAPKNLPADFTEPVGFAEIFDAETTPKS